MTVYDSDFSESDHPRSHGRFVIKGKEWKFGSNTVPSTVYRHDPFAGEDYIRSPLFNGKGELDFSGIPINKLKRVKLRTKQLTAGQDSVVSQNLRPIKDGSYPPITVAKINGKLVIVDGNHRAVSAFVQGKDDIDADYIDLDLPANKHFLKNNSKSSVTKPKSVITVKPKSKQKSEGQVRAEKWLEERLKGKAN